MQWRIIDFMNEIKLVVFSDLSNCIKIDDSAGGQVITLSDSVVTATYDFEIPANHKDAVFFKVGNYIQFQDKYGEECKYVIRSVEGEDTYTVHCEQFGFDITNATAPSWNSNGVAEDIDTVLYYFVPDKYLYPPSDSSVLGTTIATSNDGSSSVKEKLSEILQEFGLEADVRKLTEVAEKGDFVFRITKHVGNTTPQDRFILGYNLLSLNVNYSMDEYCNMLLPYGSEVGGFKTDITSQNYDDGRFYSPSGDKYLYDRQAKDVGYAVICEYDYDTQQPSVLLQKAIAELKDRSSGKISFDTEIINAKCRVGDVVQVVDLTKAEPITLEARMMEVKNFYTVKGQDTGTLANYQIKK